jgi:manganese/zinc/iron transport system permease protein
MAEQQALRRLLVGGPVASHVSPAMARWLAAKGYWRNAGLTARGRTAAKAAERNRRLWERFLIEHPSLAPATPDWGIAPIDRVLPADLVRLLEERA